MTPRSRNAVLALATAAPTEHAEQCHLVAWAGVMQHRHPELADLYAIPNGGHRHRLTAIKLQREGVRPGVPDLCLPHARGGYSALYVEMKRTKGGRLSPEQADWHARLTRAGNLVVVAKGAGAAQAAILGYLALPKESRAA